MLISQLTKTFGDIIKIENTVSLSKTKAVKHEVCSTRGDIPEWSSKVFFKVKYHLDAKAWLTFD